MKSSPPPTHARWQMELPSDQEDAVAEWLLEHGASAMYREVAPPQRYYAYFPPNITLPAADGLAAFRGVSVIGTEYFADEDWLARSRMGFGSFEVGRGLYIRPLWDEGQTPAGRIPLVVNPGLAFGTGGHETTRLCMCLLEDLSRDKALKDPVLDIGAGTGILAFTAHLLGAKDVTALDTDPDCGPAMEEFVKMNLPAAKQPVPFTPLIGELEDSRLNRKYNLLMANILLETIQELLPLMVQRLAPGGYLIASGILLERQDEALLSLALGGLKPVKLVSEGEWIAVLAQGSL